MLLDTNWSVFNVLVVDDLDRSVLNIGLLLLDADRSMLNILVVDHLHGPVLYVGLLLLDGDGPVLNVLVVNDTDRFVLDVRLVRLNTNGSMLDIVVVHDADGSVLNVGLASDELRSSGDGELMSNNWGGDNTIATMNGSNRSLRRDNRCNLGGKVMLLVHNGSVGNRCDLLMHDSVGGDRVRGAMQRQGLVGDLGVLDWVLRLRLDHMEQLVVLVLDVVLQLVAVVVHNRVHNWMEDRSSIMVHLGDHSGVVATAPEGLTVERVVLECAHLGVDSSGDAPVDVAVVVGVPLVVSRVQITSAQHELAIGNMRIEHLVRIVVGGVGNRQALIDCHVLVVHLTLCITMVESAVLVRPEELVVGGEQGHRLLVDQVALNTMDGVGDFAVRHHGVIDEASVVAGVHMLVWRLVEVANVGPDCLNGQTSVVSDEVGGGAVGILFLVSVVLISITHICLVLVAKHLVIVAGGGAHVRLRAWGLNFRR